MFRILISDVFEQDLVVDFGNTSLLDLLWSYTALRIFNFLLLLKSSLRLPIDSASNFLGSSHEQRSTRSSSGRRRRGPRINPFLVRSPFWLWSCGYCFTHACWNKNHRFQAFRSLFSQDPILYSLATQTLPFPDHRRVSPRCNIIVHNMVNLRTRR